jgi:hypothetical protein
MEEAHPQISKYIAMVGTLREANGEKPLHERRIRKKFRSQQDRELPLRSNIRRSTETHLTQTENNCIKKAES